MSKKQTPGTTNIDPALDETPRRAKNVSSITGLLLWPAHEAQLQSDVFIGSVGIGKSNYAMNAAVKELSARTSVFDSEES